MTILSLDTSVSSDLMNNDLLSAKTAHLPRISLRKRPMARSSSGSGARSFDLPAVNSAFLTGLFADVAATSSDSSTHCMGGACVIEEDEISCDQPAKKTRLSKTKSMSRCGKSFKILSEALLVDSPVTTSTSFFHEVKHQDSLCFQLNCVNSDCADNYSAADHVVSLAFPMLPASVSESSYVSTLTRKVSDLQSSINENSNGEEKYGWFVEIDNTPSVHPTMPLDPYASSNGLAFQAPTAPACANQDDELEWAQAADTVDDVLGDFF